MKSVFFSILLSLFVVGTAAAAEPTFSLWDLSPDDRLLFSAEADQPGWGPYFTLFQADLADGDRIRTLTLFPERSRYYPATGELEIQNRYGLFRRSIDDGASFRRLDFHPAFENGADIPVGRILPLASSPDGRWIVAQEPTTAVRGTLVLHDAVGGTRFVIAENQVLDYREPPALWSPDSRYLMYCRDGVLYHVSIRHAEQGRVPDESYREFGPGTLSSVRWNGADSLIYVSGSRVSLVRPSVFFARSFYADPLPAGQITGTLPIDFDPHFDDFWPSPDGTSLIALTEGRNLFLFPLDGEAGGKASSLPFLLLPRETSVLQLWWRSDGRVLLLAGGSRRGEAPSVLFSLDASRGVDAVFRPLEIEGVRRFVPSADRKSLAVLGDDGVTVLDAEDYRPVMSFDHPDPRDLFWVDESTVLVTGGVRSEIVSLEDGRTAVMAVSSAEGAVFDDEGRIVLNSGGRSYRWNDAVSGWIDITDASEAVTRRPTQESSAHRVYLEPSDSGYTNLVNVRTIDGFGNRALFPGPPTVSPAMPSDGSTALTSFYPGVFEHGSRTRGRRVAFVFNAVDGDEGLNEVLRVLDDYGIRSTFFVSGDFIRRHPEATRSLAASDHEIGSLFYTHMDMTDFRYRVDRDFVVRGLGRNEDEFFRVTGREVSTLWHAPWYLVSPAILEASERMNYTYVGRDIDPMDWVILDGDGGTYHLYKKSAELVEDVLAARAPGSIIPVRVGKPGERDDYFFMKLDLLINGLLKDGYDIVAVGEMMEESE